MPLAASQQMLLSSSVLSERVLGWLGTPRQDPPLRPVKPVGWGCRVEGGREGGTAAGKHGSHPDLRVPESRQARGGRTAGTDAQGNRASAAKLPGGHLRSCCQRGVDSVLVKSAGPAWPCCQCRVPP